MCGEAMNCATLSVSSTPSAAAFFFRIAMRASKLGSCTSVMRPIAKRLRSRSSSPGMSEGTVSLVITTALPS